MESKMDEGVGHLRREILLKHMFEQILLKIEGNNIGKVVVEY